MYQITTTTKPNGVKKTTRHRNAEEMVLKLRALGVDTTHLPLRGTFFGEVEFAHGLTVAWGAVPTALPTPSDVRNALRGYISAPVRLNVSTWDLDKDGNAHIEITTVNTAHAIRGAIHSGDTYLAEFLTRWLGRHFLLESTRVGKRLAWVKFVIPAQQDAVFETVGSLANA
ncbi:hypothetical protein [Microbispora sp. NPDC049633]|uniref:hypothetical protein n=1 Tax=Microbispora sp. NPDC049633 TaxID=3154355 RepID=UPI0034477019